jgi:hypothetical protein
LTAIILIAFAARLEVGIRDNPFGPRFPPMS